MKNTYKIHDAIHNKIYDATLEEGILYKLDERGKTALIDIPWWDGRAMGYEYNLSVFSYGRLFGYADVDSGRIVHQPRWEDALPFYYGRARVKENGKFGFINKDGEYVIEPQWDDAERSARENLLAVCRDKKWGLLDVAQNFGALIAPTEWDALTRSFGSNVISAGWLDTYELYLPIGVCRNGLWGFINNRGNIVIEPQFDMLDFIWFHYQVEWKEDKTAEPTTINGSSREVNLFGKTVVDNGVYTLYPWYLSAKRKSRWYRVQVSPDGEISILKGKNPKKRKDVQED